MDLMLRYVPQVCHSLQISPAEKRMREGQKKDLRRAYDQHRYNKHLNYREIQKNNDLLEDLQAY